MMCPICQSKDFRRSHSRGLERISRVLFARKHFQCRDCGYRWAAVSFDLREDAATLIIWAGLILAAVFLLFNLTGAFAKLLGK